MIRRPIPSLRAIFSETRTIAVVGFSANPARPSHYVAEFLARRGYRVIPVNPGLAGQEFLGTTVRASFSEITEPVDMVDIFRRSEDIPPVIDEALRALPDLSTIWMQLGLRNALAADAARAAGVRGSGKTYQFHGQLHPQECPRDRRSAHGADHRLHVKDIDSLDVKKSRIPAMHASKLKGFLRQQKDKLPPMPKEEYDALQAAFDLKVANVLEEEDADTA